MTRCSIRRRRIHPVTKTFLCVSCLIIPSVRAAGDTSHCATSSSSSSSSSSSFPPTSRLAPGASLTGSPSNAVTNFKTFDVTYGSTFKVVRTKAFTQNVSPVTYVLTQCGEAPPTTDVDGITPFDASTTRFFEVPVRSVASALTVSLAFIQALGSRSAVTTMDPGFVHDACFQFDEERGAITGADATANWNDTMNGYDVSEAWVEAINAQVGGVDLVVTDRFGTGKSGTTRDVAFDAAEGELGMLERLEAIKFLSLWFNKEPEANAYFADQVTRWEHSVNRSAYAQAIGVIPSYTCAWISNDWDGPRVSYATFERDICAGVGMTTFTPGDASSGSTKTYYGTLAELHAAIAHVNVLFDKTYYVTPSTTTKADVYASLGLDQTSAAGLSALASSGVILRMDKRVSDGDPLVAHSTAGEGLDWFESLFVHPALVIDDLSRLLWADKVSLSPPQAGCARYFRDVKDETDVVIKTTAADCPVYDSARIENKCMTQSNTQQLTLDTLFGYLTTTSSASSVSTMASIMLSIAISMALMA